MAGVSKSTKRKSDVLEPEAEPEVEADIDSDDERLQTITWSCDSVRTKIRKFIESGEMKVGKFQDALGVSAPAYGRFMAQHGRDKGSECDTYFQAHKFFKRRELQGKRVVKKKAKKSGEEGEEERDFDVSGVHLDGDVDASVPVFDSCDEVRRKIRAHLARPGVTQAAFLREAAKALRPEGRKLQRQTLSDFLGKKGPSAGNTSSAFYAAYVFFEKLRVRDGRPKSKHRVEMERLHRRGFDTESRHDRVTLMQGETAWEDKFGIFHFERRR